METENEVKIIGMLGELNNKITDISMNVKDIKERMNKNFGMLVDAQLTSNDKLDKLFQTVDEINFRLKVAEAGVGLNAEKIREVNNIR